MSSFTPMPQSTSPPSMPEVLHETPGIFPPSIPPRKQRTKVVQPIMRHEGRSETPSMKAKDMPTARASRLVATAMTSSCEWRSCPALYRLDEHLDSDEGQQEEADVGRPFADEGADRAAEQVAQKRHEELKTAEVESEQAGVLRSEALDCEPACYRDGEGVH